MSRVPSAPQPIVQAQGGCLFVSPVFVCGCVYGGWLCFGFTDKTANRSGLRFSDYD